MDGHNCMNNGVEFQSFEFQNHDCEQSIQDVHPDTQHYQEERARAVAVYVSTLSTGRIVVESLFSGRRTYIDLGQELAESFDL